MTEKETEAQSWQATCPDPGLGSLAPEAAPGATRPLPEAPLECLAHSNARGTGVISDLTQVHAHTQGRKPHPTCTFIYKAQAESRLGTARWLSHSSWAC